MSLGPSQLEARLSDGSEFVSGLTVDYEASPSDGIARYDATTGVLRINALHPFVAAFYDDFTGKSAEPLELLAMAEILAESHLYAIGVKNEQANEFLTARDQLLRYFGNQSGRQSAFSVALALKEARNNPDKLEEKLCLAFSMLGFDVAPLGKSGKPDGVATALLAGDGKAPRQYSVSLDAKSKVQDKGKVAAGTVKVSTIARHRDGYNCQHAVVVGRDFPNTGAIVEEIDDDRKKSAAVGEPKTITLITIDDLARLVQLRPAKQLGLQELRGLFQCRLPTECKDWVDHLAKKKVVRPPYTKIVSTIELLQRKRSMAQVSYSALANELTHITPPIEYATDEELRDVCKAMALMAPGSMFATFDTVQLDTSAKNVIAEIDAATKEWNDKTG